MGSHTRYDTRCSPIGQLTVALYNCTADFKSSQLAACVRGPVGRRRTATGTCRYQENPRKKNRLGPSSRIVERTGTAPSYGIRYWTFHNFLDHNSATIRLSNDPLTHAEAVHDLTKLQCPQVANTITIRWTFETCTDVESGVRPRGLFFSAFHAIHLTP